MTLISGSIRLMRIFAGDLWRGGVKRQWGIRKRRLSGLLDATSSAPQETRPTILFSIIYSVRRKKTPLNKCHYFRYSSIFFYKIFRDYSRHNLPLLLQILSSHLSLFRSSTVLNIKDDFFNCADKSDYNQLLGIF